MRVLAVDPGRQKVGLAVVDRAGAVLWRAVVARSELSPHLARVRAEHSPEWVVIGDGTASRGEGGVRSEIEGALGPGRVVVVAEERSTEEARALWLEANPPRGLWRLVPRGLVHPPGPIDDWAAVVLARRFLARKGPETKGSCP